MIHPNTELRYINDKIGFGVFATQFIPAGTIVYVVDALDVQLAPDNPLLNDPAYAQIIDHYSYINEKGVRIISWDYAKYVNHCCNFNTISTGYDFEIAIRDISPGEQITDEYAVLNIEKEMDLSCGGKNCRKKITFNDFDEYYPLWDNMIRDAIEKIPHVEQPLMHYMDIQTKSEILEYLRTGNDYKSIYVLKYNKS